MYLTVLYITYIDTINIKTNEIDNIRAYLSATKMAYQVAKTWCGLQ